MCSNFGMNLHPGRRPAQLENSWYRVISGWIARLRALFDRSQSRTS